MAAKLATHHGAAVLLLAVLGSGCANSLLGPSPPATVTPCVDDSSDCIGKRQAELKRMMADPKRSWVRETADAKAYASGVRLFAFKQRKRELSCDELVIGRKEADAGPQILRGPDGKALTLSQVSRGVMLSQEVSRELNTEMKKRCKA